MQQPSKPDLGNASEGKQEDKEERIKSEGYLGSFFLGKIFYSYDWIITVSVDDLERNPYKVTQ
jgi:hypothetical protein